MTDDILRKIKRAVLEGNYAFSAKAEAELVEDYLSKLDVAEAILNSTGIDKILRSTSPYRLTKGEKLYVIIAENLEGLRIYTKGKFVKEAGIETYYFLVSSKRTL